MQAKLKQGDGMCSELEGWKVTESWEQGNSQHNGPEAET